MSNSTEKKDVLDIITENGQLQMAMASETLGLVKAFIVEGEPVLDTKTAETAVFEVYLNAFNPAKVQIFKENLEKVSEAGFKQTSLANTVAPNLKSSRERRANEQRAQNQEMINNLKTSPPRQGV